MDIAIFGYDKSRRDELEAQLRAYLGQASPIKLTQYEISRHHNMFIRPEHPVAVFVIIDEVNALLASGAIADWGEAYPVVMVATHPQYALEGIRQKVRHYILFPLEHREIKEALQRSGVIR